MDIREFLTTDYTIMSEKNWNQWKNGNEQKGPVDSLRKRIFLLSDDRKEIIGVVDGADSTWVHPVGIAVWESLDQQEPNWDEYAIWVFQDREGQILGWTDREGLYKFLYRSYKNQENLWHNVLLSLPHQLTVVDRDLQVRFENRKRQLDRNASESLTLLLSHKKKKTWIEVTEDKKEVYVRTNILEQGDCIGAMQICYRAEEIEKIAMKLESYANLAQDLKAVFDSSYDVIYVSNGKGMTLRVSSASERLWGYKAEELVGKTVYELEQKGVFKPSITRLVLEREEKVQAIQTTKTGKRLMVVGTPIKDLEGNIIRVINTSRDITQESRLQIELEDMKFIMEGYKRELEQLRQRTWKEDPLIFKSVPMQNVVMLSDKVAEVDSTVLILGESGVGKEVIASYIHQQSLRKEKPFIKVNCSAIPENLLESELFGYEKGAFTGALKDGKLGLFEVANEGTLFLDEIGDVSLSLQVKLLRVLQEKEFVRVGGTKPIRVNVRIVAATNRNLEEEVKKGTFRRDLYYRLNVVPIRIPPLRERRDDILPLTLHFVEKINKAYNTNKSFSLEAMELLQDYQWPGNVRELQNIVERMLVLSEQRVIDAHHLPEFLAQSQHSSAGVHVSRLMSLQEAIELVEKQLLAMARNECGTTTKMAEVLGVNQSTVSRKIIKFGLF